jgi:glycerol-3-phosphate O-acyltransferase
VKFSQPISLHDFLAEQGLNIHNFTADELRTAVMRLGFAIAERINESTIITPTSLVAIALLTAKNRGVTLKTIHDQVGDLLALINLRGNVNVSPVLASRREAIQAALWERLCRFIVRL